MQSPFAQDNYALLLFKLREFKRKFYLNEILRGAIYFAATFFVSFLLVTILEYFGRFDTVTRTVLFYAFILTNLAILGRFIIFPGLSLYGLRKSLTPEQAASIIGIHFTEIKDKLLNTLQLHSQALAMADPSRRQLIEAGITQKTRELRPVPFVRAVDYKENRKYLKYAIIPLAVIVILLIQAPSMLLESTERIVEHGTYFEKPAPFRFILDSDSLRAIRQQDFTINVKVKGSELPAEVYLLVDGNPFKMESRSKTEFTYTLKGLQNDLTLRFNGGGFTSKPYELKVLPKPFLTKFDIHLEYPAYLHKKNETLQNVGDLSIPCGTTVTWNFYTENTDDIRMHFRNRQADAERRGANLYTVKARFLQDDNYYIQASNKYIRNADSIKYQLNVVPDAYPEITMEEEQDSTHLKNLYFSGQISDDYGFTKMAFRYHFVKSDDSAKIHSPEKTIPIQINMSRMIQPYVYFWDMNGLSIQPGDELEYYFEVYDNDGVNGPKFARSQKQYFRAPSEKEIETNNANNNKELENRMDNAMKKASKIQKDLTDARMRLMDKKTLDWQDKKFIQDLLDQQKELQNQIEQIQKDYNNNLQQQNEFKQMDKDLLEKHKELQDLFNEVMDEKTKKMFEELKKLLEEGNKDELQKQMDEMKFQDKEVQKELDRMKELFKQLQFEQKLNETIDKLDKLQKEQDDLSKETLDKKQDNNELQKKQDELNQKFDDLKKDLDDLEKKNDELDQKNPMEKTDEDQKNIENEMNQSQQNLQQQNNKKASGNQKNASDKMKELSEKLKKMEQDMSMDAHAEDLQSLRQILENLVYVSMEQEKLMDEFKNITQYNPQYVELAKRQRKLKDDAKVIEDSLLALSKRVMEIKSFVNKEIGEVNFNMEKSLSALGDRNTGAARTAQQFTMTSLNNLALMLSEVMQQMQANMMSSGKPGSGKGKPKKGEGPSISKMRELQDELGKKIEELKKGMNGKNGTQWSKDLAETAAQQEMLRRQLEKLNEEMNKDGKQPLGDLKKIQDLMDKNEEDIVNKRITEETLKRQQEIMVRMLESEKAEKKQQFDDQRESRTAQDKKNPNPPLLEKYLRMKEQEVELLHTVPPSLNPYYRDKVRTYFEGLK